MKVLVARDYAELSRLAGDIVTERVRCQPRAVLGLATGSTPEGLYAELVVRVRRGELDLRQVTTFNLDEYVPLAPDHPASYRSFMDARLFSHVQVAASHVPHGSAPNPADECRRYEEAIRQAGGVDMQVLGIGRNGHIGFNEPGSDFGSTTRVVELAPDTIKANARFFATLEEVPRQAISMGIRTIMAARSILLLASGADKAQAVAAAVQGTVTEAVPASVLQLHPDVTLLVDQAAAVQLATHDPAVLSTCDSTRG